MALEDSDLQDRQDFPGTGLDVTPGLTQTAFQQTAPGVYSPTPEPAPAPTPPPTGLPRTGLPRTALPSYYNHFNAAGGFTPDKDAPEYGFRPQALPEDTEGAYQDYGEAAWQGTLAMGKSLLGAVDFAAQQLNANPAIRSYIDSMREDFTERIGHSVERMTPIAQKAITASLSTLYGGNKDAQGNRIPSPGEVGYVRFVMLNLAQLVPTIVLAAIPATLSTKLALWGVRAAGMVTAEAVEGAAAKTMVVGAVEKAAEGAAGAATKMVLTETAEKVAERFGMAGAGAAFGALNGGELFTKFKEDLLHEPLEEMKKSPVYNELIASNMTDLQARDEILKRTGPAVFGMGFAVGMAAGAGVVSLATGKVLGTAGRGPLGRMVIGGGEGGAVMGAQGGANVAIEQYGQQQAGTRQNFDIAPMMAEAVAWGIPGVGLGVLGAGVGRHGGAIRKDLPAPTPVSPPGSEIDGAARAALGAALGGAAEGAGHRPRTPAEVITSRPPEMPPGPPGTQGELLHPSQVGPTVTPAPPPVEPVPMRTEAPPATAPIQAPGERTPGYQAPQPPSPMLDLQGRPEIAQPAQEIRPGMPGATQPEMRLPAAAPPAQVEAAPPVAPAATQAAVQTSQAAAPNMVVPPLAQAAVQTSQAKAPPAPVLPPRTEWPSARDMRDGLRQAGVNPKDIPTDVNNLAAAWYRQFPPESKPSTVEQSGKTAPAREAASGPGVAEQAAPQVPGALTPPAPEGVRFQPKPTTEPTAKTSTGVRPKGGAPPVTDERPAGATAEGTPVKQLKGAEEVTPGVKPDEDPRETAIGHLAAAKRRVMDEAKANGAPVRKGSAAEKAINAAMNEMQRAFNDPAQHPNEMMKMMLADARRGTPNEGQTVAAYAARRALVTGMLKEITGNEKFKLPPLKLKEVADTHSEIEQTMSEEQQRGTPRKAATSEATEDTATGAGEGGETAGLEPVHEEVPKGTSIPVKAKALVRQILDPQHKMDVPTAQKILARTSNLGRPRTQGFGDLHDALETEWNRLHGVDGQKAKAKLEAELARLDRQQPMTEEHTQARALEEGMHDRAVAKVQKKLDDWAPERIVALAKAMVETSDQVKAVTARANLEARIKEGEAPRDVSGPARTGIDPRSSRYVLSNASDPRIDAGFMDKFKRSGENGKYYNTHDFMRDVIQNPLVNSELKPLRMMATQLLKLADNIPMMTPEQAAGEMRISFAKYQSYKDGVTVGAYEPSEKIILINPLDRQRATGTYVQTGLHEIVHSIVHPYIEHLINFDPNHPALLALQAMKHELEQHFIAASKAGELSKAEIERVGYALKNLHELHTQIMTDPVVHAFASSRVASSQLTSRLAKYGFGPRTGRSIWDNFVNWTRRVLGLDPPKSASEYTMFDHIMRPAGEITEHAAEWKKSQTLPKDATLRAAAAPVYDQIGDAVRSVTKYAKRELPWLPASAMDHTRPVTMAITNMDQLVSRYRDLMKPSEHLVMPAGNPLERVRDAGEKIAYRQKLHMEKYTDKANELITDAKSQPREVQEEFYKLGNDATIANVYLGKDLTRYQQEVNARNPEAAAALQRRFDALSPEAQTIEQRFVRIHGGNDADERVAKVEGALNRVFPENTEAQNTEWKNTTSTKTRLEKFLANPDTSELAKSYGDAWQDKYAELSKLVAKTINDGWQEGDFLPLRRFGDHAIAYGERGTPSEGLERFETRGEAEERYEQLNRDKAPNLRHIDLTEKDILAREMRDSGYTERLDRALNKRPDLREHADDIRDLMNKLWLENMSRSDGSRMRRRGIQGASLDFTRVLSKEINDTAARVGFLAHGGERLKAVADMKLVRDDLRVHGKPGEAMIASRLINEIEKRVIGQESPGGAGASIARAAGTFGYTQSLLSLSHLITGSLENYSMAIPQIASRQGMVNTTLELGRVGKSLLGPMLSTGGSNFMKALGNKLKEKDWNVVDVMADHLKDAGFNHAHVDAVFNMLKRTGLGTHSYAKELKRLANPERLTSKAGRVVDYFNNLMGVWSHSVDVTNRANVAMASFNLEFRRTKGDFAAALKYAEERARDASPNYNLANKSRISTSAGMLGGMAGPITQFKQYGFHAYGILGNAVKQSFAKMPSEQRNEARYALAGMLATHALTAGTFTLIADPLRYIMGLYDWMTGATKPHDYQADLRNYLSHAVGPTMAEFISRGAINTFFGASTYRRIGFANMFEVPPLESYDTAGYLKMMGTGLVGASGEDAFKFAEGLQAFGNGDWGAGFKQMLPRPIRDAMTAHELATVGVVTQRGRTILPASNITPYEVGLQALGFQPSKVSEAREGSFAVQQKRDEAKEGHSKLIQQYLAKPDDRASIMDKVRAFNLDPDNVSAKITMQQLHNAEKEQRKRSLQPGAFGLRLPRKGAQSLIEAGSFANVQ